MATPTEINEIIKLYVGYYNRAPDPAGLNFWIDAFDNGFGLDAMAVDFSTQPETLQNYPFFENDDPSVAELGTFVDSVYMNLFNRAPDDAGREFWSTKIESGEFTVGQAISLIIEGATTSPDVDVVANKVTAGLDFYTKLNAEDGASDYIFTPEDVTAATNIQSGVTNDPASLTDAATASDTFVAAFEPPAVAGITTILTTNTDQPGGAGDGTDTQGTENDDTYSGNYATGNTGSFQSTDIIAGGDGTDTLTVRVISSTAETAAPEMSGVENIVVNNVGVGQLFTLDFNSITGEEDITAAQADFTGGTMFDNVDIGTKVRLVENDGNVFVNFKGDRSTTTNDSYDLFLEDSGTATGAAGFATTAAGGFPFDTGFENVNITMSGTTDSFLDLQGQKLESLTISGDQGLKLGDSTDFFDVLKTADASGLSSGGLTLFAAGNNQTDFAFMGSDQDDRLMLNDALLIGNNTLSLDGAAGTDTLAIDTFNSATAASVNAATGFERLEATSAANTLVASDFTSIDTFVFSGQFGADPAINITEVTGDDTFIFESDVGNTFRPLTLQSDTAGESVKIELNAQSGTGGEVRIESNAFVAGAHAAIDFGNTNFSSMEIVSSGSNAATNVIRSQDTSFGASNVAIDNGGGTISNISISGSQALAITAEAGVDLSSTSATIEQGFSSAVNLDGSAASGDLRIAGSTAADVLVGGSGDDIFYSLAGADVLTGGLGDDQFRFSDWNTTADKISDFTIGQDKVGIQDGAFNNTTASVEGSTLSAADYLLVDSIADLNTGESFRMVEMQDGQTTGQITASTGAALNTYALVFNTTSGRGELWFDADWSNGAGRQMVTEFSDITSELELVGLSNTDFVEYIF